MIIIIPLGGIGLRFKKNGYKKPKPLINVLGQPIIFYLLHSLKLNPNDTVLIPYNKELDKYNFKSYLKKNYYNFNFKFLKLDYNTEGAAETILLGLNTLKLLDQPILCLDGDNFYTFNIVSKWNKKNQVFVFEDLSNSSVYSYIQVRNDIISNIKEKEKISNLACTGAYGFESWKELQKYCKIIIDKKIKQKNEYYTSTVIKEMIKYNTFSYNLIEKDKYICLGTPLQVRIFCNNIPKINALNHKKIITPKRYCFDLDNTLVTFPKIVGDYKTVLPIQKNIDFVKYLKKLGHIIIIYTARRMKSHFGNTGKVTADIGKVTFDTLDKFNIPYDEIYFGKPYADFYIDDLGVNAFDDLEKELGYYKTEIKPRSFNNIETTSIQIFRKTSSDLSGEIYFYNNIPNEIKDMFPIMLNYDNKMKWYEMERINGIPISKLYISQELTSSRLEHIMNSIKRIQNCKVKKDNIDIYYNYIDKVKKRYQNYNYSFYDNHDVILKDLIKKINIYKNKNLGKQVVIHGDPVFTNIIINQFGKIKFIDMRGKINNSNTIQGDFLYDWAKLYQSLIGYDEILLNEDINEYYKKNIIKYFENKFISFYGKSYLYYLKLITKILLFSLIPLHSNKIKCYRFFDLIKKIEI